MSKLQKILFIINPVSGVGRQKIVESAIEKCLNKSKFSFEIAYTEYVNHAFEIASAKKNHEVDIIAVVGGDGSVNEVAKALKNSNVCLAIIPTGSGNGLALHLGIPTDVEKAVQSLNTFGPQKIDTCMLGEHFFVGTAGIGFDGLISHKFAQSKKRGFWTYVKTTVREYFKFKPFKISLTIDNKVISQEVMFVTFANSRQFGNNAIISPLSKSNDGIIEICVMKKHNMFKYLWLGILLFTRKVHKSSLVKYYPIQSAFVEAECQYTHIDGEPIQVQGKNKVEVYPNSLKVLC